MRVRIGPYLGPKSKKKQRTIHIGIENFDIWNLDHTLALIIHPALIQLKKHQHGAPHVEDDDVPLELKSTSVPKPEDDHIDDNWFKRWDWVMDEMIWAFGEIANENPNEPEWPKKWIPEYREALTKYYDRINNGTRLFGKYFRGLWD